MLKCGGWDAARHLFSVRRMEKWDFGRSDPPKLFSISMVATHSSEEDTEWWRTKDTWMCNLLQVRLITPFNWLWRLVLCLFCISISKKPWSQNLPLCQWLLWALNVNRETQYRWWCMRFSALLATAVCYFAVGCVEIWWSVSLTVTSIGAIFSAVCCIASPPHGRASLYTAVSTVISSLPLVQAGIYRMSLSFCYHQIVPVNTPSTKAVAQLLLDLF